MTIPRPVVVINGRMTGILLATREMDLQGLIMRMRLAGRPPKPAEHVKGEEESGQKAHRSALRHRNPQNALARRSHRHQR